MTSGILHDIPQVTECYITILYHTIEITVGNTINATYGWRTMGKLDFTLKKDYARKVTDFSQNEAVTYFYAMSFDLYFFFWDVDINVTH